MQWFNAQPVPVKVASLIGGSITLLAISVLALTMTILLAPQPAKAAGGSTKMPVYMPSYSIPQAQPSSGPSWFEKMQQDEDRRKLNEMYQDRQMCKMLGNCR